MTAKPRKKKSPKPLYFVVERLVRSSTGEEVGALVPKYWCDRTAMRDRKYTIGTELRGEIKAARNPAFHRLVHAIGGLCVAQIEAFAGMDQHAAIKRLQRESGAMCEFMDLDLGPLGVVPVKVPRSIAFDEMDEGEFRELVKAIYEHIVKVYWQTLTPEQVERMVEMYEGQG